MVRSLGYTTNFTQLTTILISLTKWEKDLAFSFNTDLWKEIYNMAKVQFSTFCTLYKIQSFLSLVDLTADPFNTPRSSFLSLKKTFLLTGNPKLVHISITG